MKVAEYFIKYLEQIGVEFLFGVNGANIEEIYHASFTFGKKLKTILAKHEFGAYCMAEACSHLKGMGVVITTSGPGEWNIVPGIAESYASNSPVLSIIGQPPSQLHGRGAFQDTSGINQTLNGDVILKTLGKKYFIHIQNAQEVPKHLYLALCNLLSEPVGPAIIAINKDVFQGEIDEKDPFFFRLPKPNPLPLDKNLSSTLQEISIYLKSMPKPNILIIGGRGILRENCENLFHELVSTLNAQFLTTSLTKALATKEKTHFLGTVGISAHESINKVISSADLILIIGSRLGVQTTIGIEDILKQKKVFYVNNEPSFFRMDDTNSYAVIGSIPETLKEMVKFFSTKKYPLHSSHKTLESEIKYKASFLKKEETHFPLTFENIFSTFKSMIEKDALIYVDAGNTGAAALHYLDCPSEGVFEIALGMGGMGQAICAGIGGAFVTGKKIYVFAGDGSALMNGLEMHTALEYDLSVVLVIFNNGGHAMCKTREKIFFNTEYNFDLFKHRVNFAKGFAELFPGLLGFNINNLSELEHAIHSSKNFKGPVCMDLAVSAEELPPFLPFLKKLKPGDIHERR